MKITKFVHSCLLVEMPAPENRTVLFDPGIMSEQVLDINKLRYLDDIYITHIHSDHYSETLLRRLVEKFPDVRVTAPDEVVMQLEAAGITASSKLPEGMVPLDAPHEELAPMGERPENRGVHYLDRLTHPGDSHSFNETKPILALPVTAPWGSLVSAAKLALTLQPKHVLPIHDWHWSDAARQNTYESLEKLFSSHDIVFHALQTGEPVVIDQ
jgi:L-ascorbate metabolism protein UlaG (beta-lactamase superfamily)